MSASGQWPGVMPLVFDQLSAAVNSSDIELRPFVSQKSFTCRHMLALALRTATSFVWLGPGDRLRIIERPVLPIELWTAWTSDVCRTLPPYGFIISSTFAKSTPQSAYCW